MHFPHPQDFGSSAEIHSSSGLGNKPGSSGYDGEGRSVFQAIQEDLNLKLEPRKWPVDVLVIDSVNKVPTQN